MKLTRLFLPFALLTLCASVQATDWPQWRGPSFNGSTDEKNLPAKWSKADALWSADFSAPSAATPAIIGDIVFVSTPEASTRTLHAVCLDRKSGKTLWNNLVCEGWQHDEKSNFASPSPVADSDGVFFFYGNGALAAFNHEGKPLWSRSITKDYGEFAFNWTFSASPTLYGGKLYVQVLQRNVPVHGHGRTDGPIDSYILAIDPASGKTLWRQVRPADAVAESLEAYTTPIPFEFDGRKELLIAGGDCLTGHDPATGKELWRWGTWNPHKITHWRFVPSPVSGGGVILVCAPKGDPIYAIKAGGKGTLDDGAIAWKTTDQRELSSDVPTPLFYDGDFFVLSDVRKHLSRVDPATGKERWTIELPGYKKFEASPTGGDGKIYMMNFAGEVLVVDAAKGDILNNVAMGDEGDDMTRSSVAISHQQLFIRTNHKLYCIANK